jgi:hypothetical protein
MLADSCESATRANTPSTHEEIEALVTRIIQQRLDMNQLDYCGMTLTDIKVVKDSIVRTLKGMYHPRVKYPTDRSPQQLESPQPLVLSQANDATQGQTESDHTSEQEPDKVTSTDEQTDNNIPTDVKSG